MKLIFFQNCVSPHQIPYIKELAINSYIEDVYLIVPRYDYDERKKMGWNNKKLIDNTNIRLIYNPDDNYVKSLINNNNLYCFFSGIRADKSVYNWFKISLQFNVKRFIITEPPLTYNKPLWMHYIRFFIKDYKYVKYIDGIFGIGEDAVKYYKTISSKWKVFPFLYVTEHNQRIKTVPTGKLKIIFVGNLCKRKNVKIIIKALKNIDDVEFTILGDGIEKLSLEKLASKNNVSVSFLGAKSMRDVPFIMQDYDVLILPSLHDGWGAVVNEAMDLGLYVIVSNKCGSKMVIKKRETGDIFISNNVKSLKDSIRFCIKTKDTLRKQVQKNIDSFKRFSGECVAKYFIECINKL